MKLVIGLVGEKGSGKQTFVNLFKEIIGSRTKYGMTKVRQVRFSDILAQTLLIWDIPISRPNLQKMAMVMNDTFGEKALANAAKFSIEGDDSDIIIFDGIRSTGEFNLIKKQKNHLIIYITANQDLRYQRLKKRSEKVGETNLTKEKFLEEEKNIRETGISKMGKKTDITIENSGTLEEFKEKIKQIATSLSSSQ